MSGSTQRSRRSFLGLLGGASVVGMAGCLGDSDSVSVLSAGSLAHTFEDHIGPAFEKETGTTIHGEYYGANAVMQMVEDRTKHPDVIVSADATLLRDRLYDEFTDWDVEFATNSVGIGYRADTELGERLDDGEPWYELARETSDGDIAIGHPDLDPLGYRAVQAFQLVEKEYDLDGFKEEMLDLTVKEPDEAYMMTSVETGSRAAAIVYRNMAVDHGMPFYEFPDEYNFASPDLADHYATVEYTTEEEGYTAEGRPVLYNATVNEEADKPGAGYELVQFLADNPDLLETAGLTVTDDLPNPAGSLPTEIDL